MKYVALLGLLCGACGGGTIEKFYDVTGPPRAIATMGFMPSGAPALLGGLETFGPKDLYRATAGIWEPALMGTHAGSATMFRRGEALYVGAWNELWRLDDEATFTWTQMEVPSGGRALGVDGAGRFYGVTDYGLASWEEGSTIWNQLPPDGDSTGGEGPVVDRDGNLYAYSLPVGISRFGVLGSSRAVDCHAPEYGNCEGHLDHLTLDGAGNLYFLACTQLSDNGRAFRLRKGDTEVDTIAKMPTKYPYCRHLQAMADGTLFLVSAVDNRAGTDTAIFRLSPGDAAFEQITDDDPENYVSVTPTDMQFLVSDDAETIYGFGDGAFSFGLVRATI